VPRAAVLLGIDRGEPEAELLSLRLIAATAMRLECPLLTADERVGSSGLVRVVW
jgi:hypothetical protein